MPAGTPVRLVVKRCCCPAEGRPDGSWRTSKPDTDNLEKALKDEMTRLHFWHDDAQVCSEIVEKFSSTLRCVRACGGVGMTDYKTVKAWFQQCRDLAQQVKAQKQKIQRIRDTAEKCTQSMSGMPMGGGAGDKVGFAVARIDTKSGTEANGA